MTNNFMILKKVFQNITFDENITKYGHEDTLFGYELKNGKIEVFHIDNPLIHIGLEKADEFIDKSKKAVENLKYIAEKYNYKELNQDVKILRIANRIKFFSFIICFIYKILRKIIFKNLTSEKPSLIFFDFYKLSNYFCRQNLKSKKILKYKKKKIVTHPLVIFLSVINFVFFTFIYIEEIFVPVLFWSIFGLALILSFYLIIKISYIVYFEQDKIIVKNRLLKIFTKEFIKKEISNFSFSDKNGFLIFKFTDKQKEFIYVCDTLSLQK